MKDYNALKNLTTYLQVKDFIIENSHLFSDTAFKVILNLFSRVDFKLSNCYAPMSFTELRQRTAKTNQSLQRAIKELERKGLIVKISGKHNPDTAIYTRAVAYNSLQKPVRSYNETNVYDLTNLVILAGIYYKLAENFDTHSVREFFHQVRKYNEITGKPYLSILAGVLITEENQGGYANRHRGMPIGKSDMPIGIGVCLIGKSDMPIGKKPLPVNQNHIPHTHTTQDSVGDEVMELAEAGNEQSTPLSSTGNQPSKISAGGTFGYANKYNEIDEELKEYIMADLIRQEQEGKINSANAVFKTLTEQDIQLYKQRLKAEKEKHHLEQLKILKILKTDWDKIKEKFKKARTYSNQHSVYVLLRKETAEKLHERLKDKISCELRDYTPEMKKYFSPS